MMGLLSEFFFNFFQLHQQLSGLSRHGLRMDDGQMTKKFGFIWRENPTNSEVDQLAKLTSFLQEKHMAAIELQKGTL